jgi:hypothetical protein
MGNISMHHHHTSTSGEFVGTGKQISLLVQVATGACQDFGHRVDRRSRMPGARSDYTAMGEEEGEKRKEQECQQKT